MRLIDADEFFKDFCELEPYEHISHEYDIDAEPISHGKWIPYGDCGVTECSCCGWNIEECVGWNYCPNCGAKMDKEEL